MSDRLIELGEYIESNSNTFTVTHEEYTKSSDAFTVTYEMGWIEVRKDDNPAHVKVTEEDDLFVIGWYVSDDADIDDCWDCVTFSQVVDGLRTLFSE